MLSLHEELNEDHRVAVGAESRFADAVPRLDDDFGSAPRAVAEFARAVDACGPPVAIGHEVEPVAAHEGLHVLIGAVDRRGQRSRRAPGRTRARAARLVDVVLARAPGTARAEQNPQLGGVCPRVAIRAATAHPGKLLGLAPLAARALLGDPDVFRRGLEAAHEDGGVGIDHVEAAERPIQGEGMRRDDAVPNLEEVGASPGPAGRRDDAVVDTAAVRVAVGTRDPSRPGIDVASDEEHRAAVGGDGRAILVPGRRGAGNGLRRAPAGRDERDVGTANGSPFGRAGLRVRDGERHRSPEDGEYQEGQPSDHALRIGCRSVAVRVRRHARPGRWRNASRLNRGHLEGPRWHPLTADCLHRGIAATGA